MLTLTGQLVRTGTLARVDYWKTDKLVKEKTGGLANLSMQ